jgi:hypothetical protein
MLQQHFVTGGASNYHLTGGGHWCFVHVPLHCACTHMRGSALVDWIFRLLDSRRELLSFLSSGLVKAFLKVSRVSSSCLRASAVCCKTSPGLVGKIWIFQPLMSISRLICILIHKIDRSILGTAGLAHGVVGNPKAWVFQIFQLLSWSKTADLCGQTKYWKGTSFVRISTSGGSTFGIISIFHRNRNPKIFSTRNERILYHIPYTSQHALHFTASLESWRNIWRGN